MKFLLGLSAALFLIAGSHGPEKSYYVEFSYDSVDDIRKLVEAGIDVGGVNRETKTISAIMHAEQLRNELPLDVVSRTQIDAPDEQYKKPADVERILKDTERAFPHLAQVESIGKTHDGRDVWAVKLTAKFVIHEEPKPTMLIDAMHHAREVMTPEVALDIVEYLTKNYESDEKVHEWMNNYEVWVVPMLNPDGNNKVWTSNSMWRKNTLGGYGVDINRNYNYAWNTCNGSSGNKSSDTYRGPNAGSEPEGQALVNLAKRIHPIFNISYHSYSEIVIYPYGCSPNKIPAPDKDIYLKVGKALASKLERDSGSGTYDSGTSYELLYNVDGGSIDQMYDMDKVMSFVIEMNSTSQGFQPSFSKWREKTVERQRAGWMYLLDQMSEPGIKKRHQRLQRERASR